MHEGILRHGSRTIVPKPAGRTFVHFTRRPSSAVILRLPEREVLGVKTETRGFWIPDRGLRPCRNGGRVVFVIPAKAGIQGVWGRNCVSEQGSEESL
jgi:hypothetical protein